MVGYKSAKRSAGDQIGEATSKLSAVIATGLMTSANFTGVRKEFCNDHIVIKISRLWRLNGQLLA
jgi:hypothetical protein